MLRVLTRAKIPAGSRLRDFLPVITCLAAGLYTPLDAQTLRGRVVDSNTLSPVPAAELTVISLSGRELATTTSDSTGRFYVTWKGGEKVTVRSQRIGYAAAHTPEFTVRADETVNVRVLMSVNVIPIDPLIITSRERSDDVSGNFAAFERRRQNNVGHFITRKDIEVRNPTYVSDLLRGIPGLELRPVPGSPHEVDAWSKLGMLASSVGASVGEQRQATRSRRSSQSGLAPTGSGPCPMQLFLDGKVHRMPISGVNVVPAMQLEAIEVYRSMSEVPAEFYDERARCGVIAMWTTRR